MRAHQFTNIRSIMAKAKRRRGFTLVELMIVVAIIGVLAALAVYGVKKYLTHSKTSEAKQTVGAITRAAAAAFEGEQVAAELATPGSSASNASGGTLCGSSTLVPSSLSPVFGKKYQPNTAPGEDFNTTNSTTGWKCLKFSISQPISYAYFYLKDWSGSAQAGTQCVGNPNFYSVALGDLDANNVHSMFTRCGKVVDAQLKLSTQIHTSNEHE